MNAAHTPGAWSVRDGFRFGTLEVFPERDGPPDFGSWAELATVESDYGDGDEEGAANARLIAAAPDLLVALERARADLLDLVESDQHLAPAIERIDGVLAKARA